MMFSTTFRFWILGCVFFALLGVQIAESTHHHESAAIEHACPVCQIVAHTPLDLAPPAATLVATSLLLLFLLPGKQKKTQFASTYYASYHSRAPPGFNP